MVTRAEQMKRATAAATTNTRGQRKSRKNTGAHDPRVKLKITQSDGENICKFRVVK